MTTRPKTPAERLREDFLRALDTMAALAGRLAIMSAQAATAFAIGTRCKDPDPASDHMIACFKAMDDAMRGLEKTLEELDAHKRKLSNVMAGPVAAGKN